MCFIGFSQRMVRGSSLVLIGTFLILKYLSSLFPAIIYTVFLYYVLKDIQNKLRNYLSKLSAITDLENGEAQIFCAPVLHWLEIDNHGRNLAPHAFGDVADINIPAIAAARVVRRYQARDDDELNLDVSMT